MKTEKEKMLAGELYFAGDPQLVEERRAARLLQKAFNAASPDDPAGRDAFLRQLLPNGGAELYIEPPFCCDYGSNITTGERVYFNFNCVVLDVAPVMIGSRTLFGPNVQVYTATHPVDAAERASGLESGKPIRIGADVWVGGNSVLCPGISIGDRSIIGAGSVVTKDIPADVLAAGNPCRVIRPLRPGEQQGS